MSQKELNQVNKVYHAIVIIAAIAMAIVAIISIQVISSQLR